MERDEVTERTGVREDAGVPAIGTFRTVVRGHAFAGPPPEEGAELEGASVLLRREPDNPADPLAVAVWTTVGRSGWRIGYLDRGVAARVAPRLDAGLRVDARLEGWTPEPGGRWHRPLVLLVPERHARMPGEVGASAERAAEASAGYDAAPRVWGRPPGVRRRRIR